MKDCVFKEACRYRGLKCRKGCKQAISRKKVK
jgi:hypothetical protein